MLLNNVTVLLFLSIGIFFALFTLFLARLIRPHNPSPEKLSTYECGEEPIGGSWIQFNVRFYVVALIFIIFEVEIAFLYPWAVVSKQFGWFAFVEMAVFVLILLAGLAYVWKKGALEWVRPKVPHKGSLL